MWLQADVERKKMARQYEEMRNDLFVRAQECYERAPIEEEQRAQMHLLQVATAQAAGTVARAWCW